MENEMQTMNKEKIQLLEDNQTLLCKISELDEFFKETEVMVLEQRNEA
jgi:hypothetical protein